MIFNQVLKLDTKVHQCVNTNIIKERKNIDYSNKFIIKIKSIKCIQINTDSVSVVDNYITLILNSNKTYYRVVTHKR